MNTAKLLLVFLMLILALRACNEWTQHKKETIRKNIDAEVFVDREEYYPVLEELLVERKISGFIKWKITNNNTEPVQINISADIPEICNPISELIDVSPGQTVEVHQTPLQKVNARRTGKSIRTLRLKAVLDGSLLVDKPKNITIMPFNEILWRIGNADTSFLIAAWVTPDDQSIRRMLDQTYALWKYNDQITLSGYQNPNISNEVCAIFTALRHHHISYVTSPNAEPGQIGITQKIDLPRDTLNNHQANCVESTVLLASLIEKIGLEPVIFVLPGHAFLGIKKSPGSDRNDMFFLETTLIGTPANSSAPDENDLKVYYDALDKGKEAYDKFVSFKETGAAVSEIDVKLQRQRGVSPLKQ